MEIVGPSFERLEYNFQHQKSVLLYTVEAILLKCRKFNDF